MRISFVLASLSLHVVSSFLLVGQDQKTDVIKDELNPEWNKVTKFMAPLFYHNFD